VDERRVGDEPRHRPGKREREHGAADRFELRPARDEIHVMACGGEPRAEIAAHGSCRHRCNAHRIPIVNSLMRSKDVGAASPVARADLSHACAKSIKV